MDSDLVKLAPEVLTLAKPLPKLLLGARTVIQQTPEIQEIFLRSKKEEWPVEKLALELEDPLQGHLATDNPQEVVQVARYLADEYQQIGGTALIISRDTGKAIGRITDEDLWQPSPIPRATGTLVKPPPRLRPELEGFLIRWNFERERDAKLLETLAPTLHPTDLVKEEGDPRLLAVTKGGRSHLVDQLRGRLSSLLVTAASGTVGNFLGHFVIRDGEGNSQAVSRSVTGIQDAKAMNLRFSRLGSLSSHVANDWGREIALAITVKALKSKPTVRSYTSLSQGEMSGATMWVGDPNTLVVLQRGVLSSQIILPILKAPVLLALRRPLGTIFVDPGSYECEGRELFDRWEILAKVRYSLSVDWENVRVFLFNDIPVESFPGVVVH